MSSESPQSSPTGYPPPNIRLNSGQHDLLENVNTSGKPSGPRPEPPPYRALLPPKFLGSSALKSPGQHSPTSETSERLLPPSRRPFRAQNDSPSQSRPNHA